MAALWPLATLGGIILLFLLLPPARIRRLLLFGYAGGFLLALVQNYTLVHLLGIWEFHHLFLAIGGVPLTLPVLWWVITIFFGHFLLRARTRATRLNRFLLITIFAAAAAVLSQVLIWTGYQTVRAGWTVAHTFLQGLLSHAVLYGFFLAMVPPGTVRTRAR
ncbi:MAG TPA: hypothetical protein GXZ26_02280 [Firmicutes bacterium]|nr:hypothetical protein [Bacillota bacterium]